MIVVGIAIMLGAGIAAIWSSIELNRIEDAQALMDESEDLFEGFDDLGFWDEVNDMADSQLDKQHDYYSAVRIAGIIGVITGAAIALYGFLGMKEAPRPSSASPSTMQTAPGAIGYCEHCGRQISSGAAWCPGCGRKFKSKGNEGSQEQ